VETLTFDITTKKPIEKKLLAYTKVLNDQTVRVKVVGIEKPGVKVVFFEERTHRKVASDFVKEPAGFARNYKLTKMNIDEVYMEVTDTMGRKKVFHF